MEAPYGASYLQPKQGSLLYPKCRFEQFESSPFIEGLVSEFQQKAKLQPSFFNDNNSALLVYWEDDKVWYHCKVIEYIKMADKFNLKYDDGVKESVKLYEEKFITYQEYKNIQNKLEPPKEAYERAPFARNEFSSHYWYQSQPNNNQQAWMDYKKREPHRRVGKDTAAKTSKNAEKFIIDDFTIIAKEYEASNNDSSLSIEPSYEEYENRDEYEKAAIAEQNERKRVAFSGQADYSGKLYKRMDLAEVRTQGFSIEDNQPNTTKVGPFETAKVPQQRNLDQNEDMDVDKFERDQIYTPKRFNFL